MRRPARRRTTGTIHTRSSSSPPYSSMCSGEDTGKGPLLLYCVAEPGFFYWRQSKRNLNSILQPPIRSRSRRKFTSHEPEPTEKNARPRTPLLVGWLFLLHKEVFSFSLMIHNFFFWGGEGVLGKVWIELGALNCRYPSRNVSFDRSTPPVSAARWWRPGGGMCGQ